MKKTGAMTQTNMKETGQMNYTTTMNKNIQTMGMTQGAMQVTLSKKMRQRMMKITFQLTTNHQEKKAQQRATKQMSRRMK